MKITIERDLWQLGAYIGKRRPNLLRPRWGSMSDSLAASRSCSLRAIVLSSTGQDVRQCAHCALCGESVKPEQDLSFEGLIQLVLMDDDEVLTSRTLWSEAVLVSARRACAGKLNMEAVLLALREEAKRRGRAGAD